MIMDDVEDDSQSMISAATGKGRGTVKSYPGGSVASISGVEPDLDMDVMNNAVRAKQRGLDIAAIMSKKAELDRASADAAMAASEATGRTAAAMTAANLGVQNATQEAVRILGSDITDPFSRKRIALEEFNKRSDEAKSLLEDIKQSASKSFFQDPLGYISAQLELPTKVTQYNLTAAQGNTALRTVGDIDSTLTAERIAAETSKKALTTQSIADSATIASQVLAQQAFTLKNAAYANDIGSIQAVNNGDKEYIEGRMKIFNMLKTEDSMKLATEQAAREKERFKVFLQENAEKVEARDSLKAALAAGMGVYGLPANGTDIENALKLYSLSPAGKEKAQILIDAGIKQITQGVNNVGMTPGESFYNLTKVPGDWSKSEAAAAVKNVVNTAYALENSKKANPRNVEEFKAKLYEEYFGKEDAKTGIRVGGKISDWNANPADSPLYKDPGLTRLSAVEPVTTTKFYQEVLAPSVKAGTESVTPSAMVSQGLEAVKAGKLTLEDVRDGISSYYKSVTQINAYNNKTVGIPPQSGFNTSVNGTGILFSSKFDMSNPTQVMNALLSKINSDRGKDMLTFGSVGAYDVTGGMR